MGAHGEWTLEELTLGPKLGDARRQQSEHEKKPRSRNCLGLCGQDGEGQGTREPWNSFEQRDLGSDPGEGAQMCRRESLVEEERPQG